MSDPPALDSCTRPSPTSLVQSPLDACAHQPTAVGIIVGDAEGRTGRQMCDGKILVADPTATSLTVKEPIAIRQAKAGSHGCDPSIVGTHLDWAEGRDEHGANVVIISNPIEVGLNSENSVADLPVVPNLASPDEYTVIVSVVDVGTKEGIGHVTVSPGPANVAAKVKTGPTERRSRIDQWRRRIWSRPHSFVGGMRCR